MRRKIVASIVAMLVMLVLSGCPQDSSATPPTLANVMPSSIPAGSGNTNVTLRGSGFKKPINAQWNNTLLLSTVFVSSSQLIATIPAAVLKSPGTGFIRALQGGTGNQTATANLSITIAAPVAVVPTLTTISPAHVVVNSPTFTMTLTGTNFISTSQVLWDSQPPLATTFVSATQLTAVVPNSIIQSTGTSQVKVSNPGTSGGTSNAMTMTKVSQLAITTSTLPAGTIGVAYTATMTATGGTTPYTWAVTTGTLPVGLTLNPATGVISGTPTAAGTNSFTVTCTDATGSMARKVM